MAAKVTIYDIAKLAGVSVGTVSGVLNGNVLQSPETAAKLRAIMLQMGYSPRRYKGRGKGNIKWQFAFLYPPLQITKHGMITPLGLALSQGADEVFGESNYQMTVIAMHADGTMPRCIAKRQVAGVIVRGGDYPDDLVEQLRGIPAVWAVSNRPPPFKIDSVGIDNLRLGGEAGEMLLKLQAKRVLLIEHEDQYNLELKIRLLACEDMLAGKGVVSRRVALKKLATEIREGDAVFVPGHDKEVAEIHTLLTSRKIKFGDSIPIVCAATDDASIRELDKRIAVLPIDPIIIGRAAARQLLWRLDHFFEPPRTILVHTGKLDKGLAEDTGSQEEPVTRTRQSSAGAKSGPGKRITKIATVQPGPRKDPKSVS